MVQWKIFNSMLISRSRSNRSVVSVNLVCFSYLSRVGLVGPVSLDMGHHWET